MIATAQMLGRDASGRFQPGMSGNPAGKKPGTRNWSSVFQQMLADGDVEAAGRLIIGKLHEGSFTAAKFIIDHVDPKPRGRPIALDVAPGARLVDRYRALTNAMLGGEISPQEAAAMARLLEREAALEAADQATASRRRAAPVETPAAAPKPGPDLHPACIPASRHAVAARKPDLRSSVSPQALMAHAPASGLHLQAPAIEWPQKATRAAA